jgi:hypothetical protein
MTISIPFRGILRSIITTIQGSVEIEFPWMQKCYVSVVIVIIDEFTIPSMSFIAVYRCQYCLYEYTLEVQRCCNVASEYMGLSPQSIATTDFSLNATPRWRSDIPAQDVSATGLRCQFTQDFLEIGVSLRCFPFVPWLALNGQSVGCFSYSTASDLSWRSMWIQLSRNYFGASTTKR